MNAPFPRILQVGYVDRVDGSYVVEFVTGPDGPTIQVGPPSVGNEALAHELVRRWNLHDRLVDWLAIALDEIEGTRTDGTWLETLALIREAVGIARGKGGK